MQGLEGQLNTEIEHTLDGITQAGSGHFGIPKLEFTESQQVRPARIDTEILDVGFPHQMVREAVAQFDGLQAEEGTVPHEPGTGLTVVLVESGGQTRPKGTDVTVVLRPMVVGIDLHQLVLLHDGIGCIRIDERRRIVDVDPEGLMSQSLEKEREVQSLVAGTQTETVDDFRTGRIADRHPVQVGDTVVAVDVAVLDVTAHDGGSAEILDGGIGHLAVIDEQALRDIAPGLSDGWGKTYIFPLFLECKHLLSLVIPALECGKFVKLYAFQKFAYHGLLVQILFLLFLELLKMLLMTLVDYGRCSLEPGPYLLS